ncbi:hypothetical protein NLI96_g9181 [Meripilus lineatus]|uniref:DUF6533 domain-containing protein n=1 Tax=Meripilus lineatus TaxID=2056292 RepID=A0AAD5UXP0_9APHY|nr:hypothetical protein NLI96_g9181 [Physisporinus lineatus]
MSEKPEEPQVDLENYYIAFRVHAALVSVLALLVYDIFCTLGKEAEVIWKRKFSIPSLLYLVIRVSTLGNALAEVSENILGPATFTVRLDIPTVRSFL